MSIVFYGYWSPRYVLLLLASIVVNFFLGQMLLGAARAEPLAGKARADRRRRGEPRDARLLQVRELLRRLRSRDATGARRALAHIVLPIGISFFTFTQIAFLVDAYRGKVARVAIRSTTLLFVTLLPAPDRGPDLHHAK